MKILENPAASVFTLKMVAFHIPAQCYSSEDHDLKLLVDVMNYGNLKETKRNRDEGAMGNKTKRKDLLQN
jgi:hypothetical protein